MSPACLAAKAAERRRAEQSAEFARQLPLYREEVSEPPAEYMEWIKERGEDARGFVCSAPDWSTNY